MTVNPNVAQRSLQSYACSIITVVYDKYYSACKSKPKVVNLPRDLHLSRSMPKATKSHILKPQKPQTLKPQAAKISLKRNSGVCNIYVNMTLKTVASVKYDARGKATIVPALGLEYAGLHCYEKVKTLYDMICIYEMTESFRKPIFQEGYKLSYYPTGQIRLANNFRYTAGSRYTIRYEHKSSKTALVNGYDHPQSPRKGFQRN